MARVRLVPLAALSSDSMMTWHRRTRRRRCDEIRGKKKRASGGKGEENEKETLQGGLPFFFLAPASCEEKQRASEGEREVHK